ncbi:MAG: VOC family protein [Burkholderiaceae bacterium]
MSARVTAVHHFTIGCAPADLPALLRFYTETLGLQDGHRPALRNPGHWLYADGQAIVHLNALHRSTPESGTGPFDHVALRAHGLRTTRDRLRAANVPFTEAPLTGTHLYQVFVHDPLGVRIELNFDLDHET